MFKKWASYFLPINIHRQKSEVSRNIEITWNNGQLVLDSQNTNYSYGSLQKVLRKGLKAIGFEKICSMEHILVLGVAGGSVIKTLTSEVKYKGEITGVEIDPAIISVANQYFELEKIPNLQIVIDDAFEFVLKTRDKYDLIIIDIFRDTEMPNFLFEKFFVNRICYLLKSRGIIMFNTMTLNTDDNIRNDTYRSEFDPNLYSIKTVPRLEHHNELILIQKKS